MQLHATTVAIEEKGVLILGPSGSGKSTLALQLMAVGAVLVADDRTDLRLERGTLLADCPAPLRGQIEARGVGILSAASFGPVPVMLACNLGLEGVERLPQQLDHEWLGVRVSLVPGPYRPHLYAALRQLMLGHRLA